MRVWDVPPCILCRQHLLGEHREIHAIWSILTEDKDGYRQHPEVKRWEGRTGALRRRHAMLVDEMKARGYNHDSDLGPADDDTTTQRTYVDTPEEQREILAGKDCPCPLERS